MKEQLSSQGRDLIKSLPEDNRHIAFIDVLGIRRALSMGKSNIAESKLIKLSEIVDAIVPRYHDVCAHGATDFFLLWSSQPNAGWDTALAARDIFQKYFDLNTEEDIESAYLLRAGLAYGEVKELTKTEGRVTYSILLGDGLSKAYETQATRKGMRLFLSPGASRAFRPKYYGENATYPTNIKIDRHHCDETGALDYSEIRWVGYKEEVDSRLHRANKLFKAAVKAFRHGLIEEGIVQHYQQTLCAVLGGCSSPELLSTYLTYDIMHKDARPFLGPILATAWLRLFRKKSASFLLDHRDLIHEKFLRMSGSPMISAVSRTLSRHNHWISLIRFLRSGKLRFAPRIRK